jgi:hypothetical protein
MAKGKRAGVVLFLFLGAACTRTAVLENPSVTRVDDFTLKVSSDAIKNLKVEAANITEVPERLELMGRVGVTEDRTTVVPARVAGRIE